MHPIKAGRADAVALFGNRNWLRLVWGALSVLVTLAFHLWLGATAALVAALVMLGLALLVEVLSPLPVGVLVTKDGLSVSDHVEDPDGGDDEWSVPWERVVEIRAEIVRDERVISVIGTLADEQPRTLLTLGKAVPSRLEPQHDVLDPAASFELLRAHAPGRVMITEPADDEQPAPEADGDAPAEPPRSSRLRRYVWMVALLGLAVVSFSIGSSWTVGLALTAVIFVHEMGHVLAVLARRLPIKGMFFLPFLGAVVVYEDLDKQQRSPDTRVFIALAGPVVGGLVALAVWSQAPHHHTFAWWFAIFGLVINLANLIPAMPLDGGQVVRGLLESQLARNRTAAMAVLIPSVLTAGGIALVVLVPMLFFRLLFLCFALGAAGGIYDDAAPVVTDRWLARHGVRPARLRAARAWFAGGPWSEAGPETPDVGPIPGPQVAAYATVYLGLAAALGAVLV